MRFRHLIERRKRSDHELGSERHLCATTHIWEEFASHAVMTDK
jgi:hypothetical protein